MIAVHACLVGSLKNEKNLPSVVLAQRRRHCCILLRWFAMVRRAAREVLDIAASFWEIIPHIEQQILRRDLGE